NRPDVAGFSSVFSFPKTTLPLYSLASPSIIGETKRQGPHHGAQQSTRIKGYFEMNESKLESSTTTGESSEPVITAQPSKPEYNPNTENPSNVENVLFGLPGRLATRGPGPVAVRAADALRSSTSAPSEDQFRSSHPSSPTPLRSRGTWAWDSRPCSMQSHQDESFPSIYVIGTGARSFLNRFVND